MAGPRFGFCPACRARPKAEIEGISYRAGAIVVVAGKRDEIVPPKMAEALWKASGEQKIVWYDCTHFSAVKYIVPAMGHIVKHFGAE